MKKMDDGKLLRIVLWLLLCAIGAYILIKGMSLDKKTLVNMCKDAQEKAIEAYLPGILETEGVKTQTPVEWLCSKVEEQLPFLGTIQAKEMEETEKDRETDKKIMEEIPIFLRQNFWKKTRRQALWGPARKTQGAWMPRVKTNKARKIRKLCRMQPKRMHRQQTRVMAGRQRLLQPMP